MRHRSDYKKNITDLIILYFRYRKCYNIGFQKYLYFKSLMRYVTEIDNYVYLRRLFEELINRELIEKKFIMGSVRYRFNPNKKYDIPNQPIVLHFL